MFFISPLTLNPIIIMPDQETVKNMSINCKYSHEALGEAGYSVAPRLVK